MVEVTEADRIAAAAYMKLVGSKRWSQEGILDSRFGFAVTTLVNKSAHL